VTRRERNKDVNPVLQGIHLVPHVNVTLNRIVIIFVPLNSIHLARLYCDAAKHHQQWKVRLIRDPELPLARYIDITHVASSFPAGFAFYANRFQSTHNSYSLGFLEQ
jgi:hypothetical protein